MNNDIKYKLQCHEGMAVFLSGRKLRIGLKSADNNAEKFAQPYRNSFRKYDLI